MANRALNRGRVTQEEWRKLLEQAALAVPAPAEPTPREPWALGYIRCSHLRSEDTKLGLNIQRQTVERYFDLLSLLQCFQQQPLKINALLTKCA